VRSKSDAELLYEAKYGKRGADGKMSREQYAALRRRVGGTAKGERWVGSTVTARAAWCGAWGGVPSCDRGLRPVLGLRPACALKVNLLTCPPQKLEELGGCEGRVHRPLPLSLHLLNPSIPLMLLPFPPQTTGRAGWM